MRYYSLKKILAEKADYNIIIGERSNGKTYACLKYAIETYVKYGYQSIYLRRFKEDLTYSRSDKIFENLNNNNEVGKLTNNEWQFIVYSKSSFYFARNETDKNGNTKIRINKNAFCFTMSLSDMEHDKSTSYPDVKTVIFDEFITRRFYLADEFVIFMNVLSTVIRERHDVKIFMLGNTVNKYSPYFEEMGLTNITIQKQGTIDIYTYGDSDLKVAVEYCNAMNKNAKKSNKYFAFNNSKLNMIKNGQWELDLYPHLRENQSIKSSDIIFEFFIEFMNKKLACDVIENENGSFIFIHKKTTDFKKNDIVYTLNFTTDYNIRKCFVYHMDKIDDKICNYFKSKKVFYQSNEIGEIVKNYLSECLKKSITI